MVSFYYKSGKTKKVFEYFMNVIDVLYSQMFIITIPEKSYIRVSNYGQESLAARSRYIHIDQLFSGFENSFIRWKVKTAKFSCYIHKRSITFSP